MRPEIFSLIEEFLQHLRVLHRVPGTLASAKRCLGRLAQYVEAFVWKEWRDLTPQDLERYVRSLSWQFTPRRGDRISPAYLAQHVSWLRQFFRYLKKANYLLLDPSCGIPLPHVEKLPKVVLTVEEMEAVLSAPDVKRVRGLRDRAMVELLYSSALRVSELVRLNVGDLDLTERLLWVRKGKGGKDRRVPVGRVAHLWLLQYLSRSRPVLEHAPSVALWLSNVGNRLDPHDVHRVLKRYCERVGIMKKVTPHLLRHTCATHLLEGGADLRSIQELLGHASIATTQIYVRSSVQHLKETVRSCHPRGTWKGESRRGGGNRRLEKS